MQIKSFISLIWELFYQRKPGNAATWKELLATNLRTSKTNSPTELARLINKREYLLRYELGFPATSNNYRLIELAQNGDLSLKSFLVLADRFPKDCILESEEEFIFYVDAITFGSPREHEDILALLNMPNTLRGKEIVAYWRLNLTDFNSMISQLYAITSTVYISCGYENEKKLA